MKSLVLTVFTILYLINIQRVSSQVTISEIAQEALVIGDRPASYDSLKNLQSHDDLKDYQQYIGLQIFLPPTSNNSFPFLFSTRINTIKTGVESTVKYFSREGNSSKETLKTHVYDSLMTYVYKPVHYYFDQHDADVLPDSKVCSDSSEISNTYYTILDVMYGKRLRDIVNNIKKTTIDSQRNSKGTHKFVHDFPHKSGPRFMDIDYQDSNVLFLLKNNKTNDRLYGAVGSNFILVPYFVKQKELYEGKKLIYDDDKSSLGFINSSFEANDPRYLIKSEDKQGDLQTHSRKVKINIGSTWLCKEVTLLKPSYEIHYILQNVNGEQIALKNIKGFIEASLYAKRESERKTQKQELLAKRKREAIQRDEKLQQQQQAHKAKMISLFGSDLGSLIASGKVKINMTREMCKYSWGEPLWFNKTTTENKVSEDWHYTYGHKLYFIDGLLKRIEE